MDTVNPHYLDHVVAAAAAHEVEATQDIVAGNGMKLLAKGARIDANTRERLLQHKLSRPLEDCLAVTGGITPEQLGPAAEALMAQHPLLAALAADARAQAIPASLAKLRLSLPVQSLLTVYAGHQDGRLDHAVGVALLALALARRLLPGDVERHRMLATAGLLHDVGELYIAPAFLARGTALAAEQWKHIVSHPVSGHRVLRDLDGAGPAMAEAVLCHHERLDGFGYPRGLAGEQFPVEGQILACAEWLMGLTEASAHASISAKLMPGEFSDALLDILRGAARTSESAGPATDSGFGLQDVLPRAIRVTEVLQRFRDSRALIDAHIAEASPELGALLALCLQRMLQLQASFTSAGLDLHDPQHFLHELASDDAEVEAELVALVREFSWRMRELKRATLMRSGLMSAADQALVQALIATLNGEAAPAD